MKYNIYPTLLDSFSYFLESESMTEADMIDRINRKSPVTESMMKGTAFNNLIDNLCDGKEVKSFIDKKGDVFYESEAEGFRYLFPVEISDRYADIYRDSLRQLYLHGNIMTRKGEVYLYGFADGVFIDGIRDIKTSKTYKAQKFLGKWQPYAYIHCLRCMGCDPKYFIFDATDSYMRNIYSEYYPADFFDMRDLVNILERFIMFCEKNNHLITGRGRKIFGEEVL